MPAKANLPVMGATTVETAERNGLDRVGEGRRRVIVERVTPETDGGRYPIKRVIGEAVVVECDAFADGHEVLAGVVLYRQAGAGAWREAPLALIVNDRWRGQFSVEVVGRYEYTVQVWVDRFLTWEHQLHKRVEAGQDVAVDLLIGADLVAEAADHAPEADATVLRGYERELRGGDVEAAFMPDLAARMARHLPRRYATTYDRTLQIVVDIERACFSAWYELFPRSAAAEPGRHGTLQDVIRRLPYVAELGFDVLYLPPIHPIGRAFRKGKNNSVTALPGEPGSPWAIGAAEGGHMSVHPELGTLDDLRELVVQAKAYGIALALDIAFQCAPDHPYVTEHPEWFRARPDGTIQYAENPPKKYQDIYPFDFETSDWEGLWHELRRIFVFWIEQGVTVFRVDNPHTKAFRFWEWCIGSIKGTYPEVIFLAEAFTRPKLMYGLAKMGFTQGYTYFTWRTTKVELTQYMLELTQTEAHDYFRPNFWPNTPDILTPQFYPGHRAVFITRAVLAATLTASWGMYGPVYELMEHIPVRGREEYINSEKYEVHHWDLERPDSLRHLIARLNGIRKQHVALQRNHSLRFHRVEMNFAEHDQLIAYSKASPDLRDIVLTVVNLDPLNTQSGWVQLPLQEWGLEGDFQVHDLLNDARYIWRGEFSYVELSPQAVPAHIFVIRRRVRDERGFEYFA